jgi:undecaprenyl-diphosphatase
MQWFENILQFDTHIFLLLNGVNSPWWDTAMLFFTRKETWLMLYLMLVVVIIRNYERKSWLVILFLILGVIASDQLSTLLKELIQRLRPGHEPALEGLVHIVLRRGGTYGFVSSHASNTFFVLTFATALFRNRWSFFSLLTWASLVSYSRIYNGNHYPLDIIGGIILGIVIGVLFYRSLLFIESRFFITLLPRFQKMPLRFGNGGLVFMAVVIIISTVLILVEILHKYNYM